MSLVDGWLTWDEIQATVWPEASRRTIIRHMGNVAPNKLRERSIEEGKRGPRPREIFFDALPSLPRERYEFLRYPAAKLNRLADALPSNVKSVRIDMDRAPLRRVIVRVAASKAKSGNLD